MPHAFRTCMSEKRVALEVLNLKCRADLAGAEHFCAFSSRPVSKRATDSLSFYNVLAGVARQRPSITNVRVQYFGSSGQSRLHPSGSCVSSSENFMNFMHFQNSSTRNRDHHILLIMTGNAHQESCHKLLSLILVRKQ